MVNLKNDWQELLDSEFNSGYYQSLRKFLIEEYKSYEVYPKMHDIYNSLKLSSYKDTRVVILGQDPYHGKNQAHGLCFSVKDGVKIPPSLNNIFKEINSDLGLPIPQSGNLINWARQGVLLLNTTLTVREGCPMSHKDRGWERLTDKIISLLNEKQESVIFLLWGSHAKSKLSLITNPNHYILQASHPSPLSAFNGFFGCKHFSCTNEILLKLSKTPIDWNLS